MGQSGALTKTRTPGPYWPTFCAAGVGELSATVDCRSPGCSAIHGAFPTWRPRRSPIMFAAYEVREAGGDIVGVCCEFCAEPNEEVKAAGVLK